MKIQNQSSYFGESYGLLDLASCDFTHDCVTGSNGGKNDAHLTEVELRFGQQNTQLSFLGELGTRTIFPF
jgi:hypothetical protein